MRKSPSDWVLLPGVRGRRYTAAEVAHGLGVSPATVAEWLQKGWLRGSRDVTGVWRIKHRAVRRALMDFKQVASAAMAAANPDPTYERLRREAASMMEEKETLKKDLAPHSLDTPGHPQPSAATHPNDTTTE